jgi:hypothetical protein
MLYSTADIIKALEKTHGMVYLAAEDLGCAAMTIYRRAEKVQAVQDTINSYRGKLIDKAELKLEQAVLNGEPWAIQITLRTIGKHRGYVERQEVTGADGGAIVVNWDESENND